MNSTEIALQKLASRMKLYLQLNTRAAGELTQKKAGDFAIQMYAACADAAPSESQIASKVNSLGWRVKRRPGAWKRRPGETGQQVLARMHQAVTRQRAAKRYYVASGYLPAVNKLRGSGAGRRKTVRPVVNPRGKVEFFGMNGSKPTIVITNSTPGVSYVVEKTNAVEVAATKVSNDLLVYIDRKQREAKAKAGLGNG